MPEPKVGMKFGSYDQARKELSNRYPIVSVEGEQDGITSKTDRYHDRRGNNIADLTFSYSRISEPDEIGDYDIFVQSKLVRNGLEYEGKTIWSHYNKSDIQYSHIYGDKTYAFDYNNNGIVDKGEIFPRINK